MANKIFTDISERFNFESMLKKYIGIFSLFILLLPTQQIAAQSYPSPDLSCVSNLPNGDVQLIWNVPVVGCGPFVAYNIYYSTVLAGPYSLLASVTNAAQTSYVHTGANGNVITYYYYIVADYNCPGFAAIASDTIDNLDPAPPELQFVTTSDTGNTMLWFPSTSPETYGYIIYDCSGGNFVAMDTIYGISSIWYTDSLYLNSANPNSSEVCYSVAAFDSCFNTGPIFSPPHHTIYLEVDTPGLCETTINLQWTLYDNWPPAQWVSGVEKYHVYAGQFPNSLYFVANLPGGVDSTFQYQNVNGWSDVCFAIFAISDISGWVSQSNVVCVPGNIFYGPTNFYVRNVTVSAPNTVDISYSFDPGADITVLAMERSTDGVNFSQLSTIPLSSIVAGINVYTDLTANTDQFAYCYRLAASNDCGGKDYSSVGCSMLLTGYAFSDGTNHLDWNASDVDFGTSGGYDVLKDILGIYSTIATVLPGNPLSYEEVVTTDSTCYVIESNNHMVFPNGIDEQQVSTSNIKCLIPPSAVYMPNAFAPEGTNNIFTPVFDLHGQLQTYSFSVFNRWGALLWQTADPDQGWDGTFNGKPVPQGAYAYYVTVLDASGQQIERKGTVMVLR